MALAANARRLIAFDPTHEGASRALMRALADMGERAQALREYERCRKALRKVLDVEPSQTAVIITAIAIVVLGSICNMVGTTLSACAIWAMSRASIAMK